MNISQRVTESPEGGTVRIGGGELPGHGYFVGGLVSSLIFDPSDDLQPGADIDHFAEYVEQQLDAPYLGWWTDEENGMVYVDATTWHETLAEAKKVGRERNEIAIFDVVCKTSIYLNEG